jgi:hypothetical protein
MTIANIHTLLTAMGSQDMLVKSPSKACRWRWVFVNLASSFYRLSRHIQCKEAHHMPTRYAFFQISSEYTCRHIYLCLFSPCSLFAPSISAGSALLDKENDTLPPDSRTLLLTCCLVLCALGRIREDPPNPTAGCSTHPKTTATPFLVPPHWPKKYLAPYIRGPLYCWDGAAV